MEAIYFLVWSALIGLTEGSKNAIGGARLSYKEYHIARLGQNACAILMMISSMTWGFYHYGYFVLAGWSLYEFVHNYTAYDSIRVNKLYFGLKLYWWLPTVCTIAYYAILRIAGII